MSKPNQTHRRRVTKDSGLPKSKIGEFANENNEADVSLEGAPVYNARGFIDDNPVGGLDGAGLAFHSIKIAKQVGYKMGLSDQDIEDIAQDAVEKVLEKKKRLGVEINGGLLRGQIGFSAAKLSNKKKNQNGTDSKARKDWLLRVATAEQGLGRELTGNEEDAISVEIIEETREIDHRHVPSPNFHRIRTATSLDEPESRVGANLAAIEPAEALDDDDAHELVDNVSEIGKMAARRKAWNALAKIAGGPPATAGTVKKEAASKALRTVTDAYDLANRVLDGSGETIERRLLTGDSVASKAEIDALFLPYGKASDKQKLEAAAMIADRPNVGHKIWKAALECSNEKFYQTV